MRAAIYLRQSLDRTGEELAVSRQRDLCRNIIELRGWTLVDEFTDNSISASDATKNRPGYNALVEAYDAGRFDALVCYDMDRLTRQPRQMEDWLDAAEQRGLALVTANGEADLTTDAGRTFVRVRMAFARGEVERKSARQKAAERQRATAGKAHGGRRSFGYTRDGQLFNTEAAPLREAYSAILAGASLYSIATQWNNRGLKTTAGKDWSGSTVRQVLVNPRYAGLRVYQGEVIGPAEWPALVTEDVWRATKDLLSAPGRRRGMPTGRINLLTGIALCGVCHQTIGSAVKYGQRVYACKRRDCFAVSRQQSAVDEWVVEHVTARLARPDAAAILARDDQPDVAQLRDDAAALRARLDTLAVEFADGELTPSQMRIATDRLKSKLAAVESQMFNANTHRLFDGVIGAADVRAAFDSLPLDRRRAIVDALVTITVLPIGKGGAFDPSKIRIDWK